MLFDVVQPTALLALTSGPSQPEVQSFEPVNTTEMVDPFTGDFNYNIPLLTVPGPNGGYPINLAYHAGIGMEQEASWVGLGWNLNVGALNRSMRGLPDDLNGEIVSRTVKAKPEITIGMAFAHQYEDECFGVKNGWLTAGSLDRNWGVQFYINNYRGVGISGDFTIATSESKMVAPGKWSDEGYGISASLDPQTGAGVSPVYSLGKNGHSFNVNAKYSTRQGLYSLGLGTSDATHVENGHNLSFNSNSYIPGITTPTFGMSFVLEYSMQTLTATPPFYFRNRYMPKVYGSWTDEKDESIEMPAYGYLYSDQRSQSSTDPMLMDINRENEVPVTRDAPYLPVPSFTCDAYMASGQGMGLGFRGYRSDVGVLYDPRSSSDNVLVNLGLESSSTQTHLGLDVQLGYSRGYAGKWNNDNDWDAINEDYMFQEFTTSNEGSYEPFYFKSPSDMTATDSEEDRYNGTGANAFDVHMVWAPEGALLSFKPKVRNKQTSDGNSYLTGNMRTNRDKRTSNIEYRTLAQLIRPTVPDHKYVVSSVNNFPGRGQTTATAVDYQRCMNTYSAGSSQIGEYTILGSDGMRYEYAIPAYNTEQKEVMFSVAEASNAQHYVPYNPSDASTANDEGRDKFYSSTELPAYAYSYLLTAVYSADYVDLKGDGPTEDDLGYFAKFNYTPVITDYQWRAPFGDANYLAGYHSDALDDKATYAFGKKEIWLLNSVETKTHIAEFYVSDRNDGRGVYIEHNTTGMNGVQKKLDKIQLYSKSDRLNPIKTVHFEYDYSLCKGVPNNLNNTPQNPVEGKLTLQKIWFEYKNNNKGKLTPYQFYYREDITAYNPEYNLLQMDRWGMYKQDRVVSASGHMNEDDPYVTQNNQALVDQNAAAWSLYRITLPSGGKITVDYEADDYAYVQDKPATQMFEILHTGSSSNNGTGENRLYDDALPTEVFDRIYFNLENPTVDPTSLNAYITGVEQMYFKTYVKLKKYQDAGGTWHDGYDYVDGFCKVTDIDFDPTSYSNGLYSRAYVTVDLVSVLQDDPKKGHVHPFSKASWEYMKVERPDLLYQSLPFDDNSTVLQNIAGQAMSIGYSYFRNISQLLLGYYTSCRALGYAKELNLSTYHPSFIRLNSPDGIKVGGGHRVKRISMSDNWYALTNKDIINNGQTGEQPEATYSEYGVEYSYRDDTGLHSSGVASYEPLIGGEENPLKLPTDKFSNGRRFIYNQKDFYLVEPIGESYYPAPVVGYSRVTIQNIKHIENSVEVNESTAPGITVLQFYTARDFPVRVEPSDIDDCHYSPKIIIPFIGNFDYNNHGYSQGYSVWLNDMHGRLKSVSTYAYQLNPVNNLAYDKQFETRTEYFYKTDATDPKKLNNVVDVLDADGLYRSSTIGQQTEFFMDMIQHSGFSLNVGAQMNLDAVPPLFVPGGYPKIDYSEQMFRSVVGMKVTMQNGVLQQVKTTRNGAAAYANNLMFDAETGQPLLTSLTNEHENPVYSYSYAAHWDYAGMGSAYRNYGVSVITDVPTDANGNYVAPSGVPVGANFNVGDQVEVNVNGFGYLNCWVNSINGSANSIELIDENGTHLSNQNVLELRVVRSARTNQTSASMGHIVALDNPVTGDRLFPLFDAFNQLLISGSQNLSTVTFTDCATGEVKTVNITIGSNYVQFYENGETCVATITFPTDANLFHLPLNSNNNIYVYRFDKRGHGVSILDLANQSVGLPAYFIGGWSDPGNCYKECMQNVLDAGAIRYNNSWNYNYLDLGNPAVTIEAFGGTIQSNLNAAATNNEYRFGRVGIWRAESNSVYQVDRKQSIPEDGQPVSINTKRDGVYENFAFYNWQTSLASNSRWSLVNTMTMYSPYGFDLENRNALGQYSSALYGYGNSVATCVTSNATYYESAFDGFEDHGGTYVSGHGHFNLLGINAALSNQGHTGKHSVQLTSGNPTASCTAIDVVAAGSPDYTPQAPQTAFSFVENRKYSVCAWFKKDANAPANSVPQINITGGAVVSTEILPQKIEGWQRVEVVFTAPVNATNVDISFTFSNGGTGLLDDIRIQPFTSAMKTFVYDPITLWLVAELDNRNFATFYNYDEEGSLVQVKKETEKGIVTVKTARNNVAQKVVE